MGRVRPNGRSEYAEAPEMGALFGISPRDDALQQRVPRVADPDRESRLEMERILKL
jgi:hypothetical protein